MKFPLPRPVFPDVVISPSDEQELVALVNAFIDKLLVEEHTYLVAQDGAVDVTTWKHLRQSENIAVYRERTIASSDSSAASSGTGTATVSSVAAVHSDDHHAIPPFLVVGKVAGSLDDLLYGFTTPTREATVLKTSYVDDNVVDVELLHQIQQPTLDGPFSHLSVKWAVVAPHATIMRPRDYVFVDTIGTRTLADGKRIGYRLTHSIDVKGTESAPHRGMIRANMSMCTIFREGTNNHVHLYGRAFFEPGGDIPRAMFISLTSAQLSLVAMQVLAGQAKKLALALRRTDQRTWTIATPVSRSIDPRACGVCKKKLHLLNKSRSKCALCVRRLCHSCRVRKQLSFLSDDCAVTRLRVTFCSYCVQQAISLPSSFAASEEFLSGQEDFYCAPQTSFRAPPTTSTSVDFNSFLSA